MEVLFLDANIYLDFYRYGDDDLAEIGKLLILVIDGDVKLLSNNHLTDEIARNRDAVLARSFSELTSSKLSIRTPNYCERFDDYKLLNEKLKELNKIHGNLVKSVKEKIDKKKLPADILIDSLMTRATKLQVSEEILQKAGLRVKLGNPPGKNGSLGDALHWECLLGANTVYNVSIVSKDADFASELDRKKVKDFLFCEWRRTRPHGRVTLYPSLTEYFKKLFPNIKLSDETKKRNLIDQLESSQNFSTTHDIISELSGFSFFTSAQVQKLFSILINNSQVRWISGDKDINEFFLSLQPRSYVVKLEDHDEIALILGVDADSFFLPF